MIKSGHIFIIIKIKSKIYNNFIILIYLYSRIHQNTKKLLQNYEYIYNISFSKSEFIAPFEF